MSLVNIGAEKCGYWLSLLSIPAGDSMTELRDQILSYSFIQVR
jgi:hypothetical protein